MHAEPRITHMHACILFMDQLGVFNSHLKSQLLAIVEGILMLTFNMANSQIITELLDDKYMTSILHVYTQQQLQIH